MWELTDFSFLYAGILTGFILYRSYTDHEFMSTAILSAWRHCFVPALPDIQIFRFFQPLFYDGSWILGEDDVDVSLWLSMPLKHILHSQIEFLLIHFPLHKERSLMRFEISTVYTEVQFMSTLQSNPSRFTSRACELSYLCFAWLIALGICFLHWSGP